MDLKLQLFNNFMGNKTLLWCLLLAGPVPPSREEVTWIPSAVEPWGWAHGVNSTFQDFFVQNWNKTMWLSHLLKWSISKPLNEAARLRRVQCLWLAWLWTRLEWPCRANRSEGGKDKRRPAHSNPLLSNWLFATGSRRWAETARWVDGGQIGQDGEGHRGQKRWAHPQDGCSRVMDGQNVGDVALGQQLLVPRICKHNPTNSVQSQLSIVSFWIAHFPTHFKTLNIWQRSPTPTTTPPLSNTTKQIWSPWMKSVAPVLNWKKNRKTSVSKRVQQLGPKARNSKCFNQICSLKGSQMFSATDRCVFGSFSHALQVCRQKTSRCRSRLPLADHHQVV